MNKTRTDRNEYPKQTDGGKRSFLPLGGKKREEEVQSVRQIRHSSPFQKAEEASGSIGWRKRSPISQIAK
jgi:hypothetical protein